MIANFLGMEFDIFMYYMIWATLGAIFSITQQQHTHREVIKVNGGFNLGFWIKDNWKRMVGGFLMMVFGVVLMKQFTGEEPSIIGAIMAGYSLDTFADRFKKKQP